MTEIYGVRDTHPFDIKKDPIVEKLLQQFVIAWYSQGAKKPYARIQPFMKEKLELIRLVFGEQVSTLKGEAFRLMVRSIKLGKPKEIGRVDKPKKIKLEKIVRLKPRGKSLTAGYLGNLRRGGARQKLHEGVWSQTQPRCSSFVNP